MLEAIFEGILDSDALTLGSFMIVICSALVIGLAIALVYGSKSRCSSGFKLTLALLPAITAVIITMVSGSLGASIAVAGTFSLVRFRSAQGTAKEIGALFLGMAAGLACGMGYPAYAALFTILILAVFTLYTALRFGESDSPERTLSITIPENISYSDAFNDVFNRYTVKHKLLRVKTTNLGSLIRLTYSTELKSAAEEQKFIDELRCINGNLEISVSATAAESEL